MRVLGIDCGSERTGYGVIESDGAAHRLLIAGVIRTSSKSRFEARLLEIANGLRALIREHAPESAAVEGIFHAVNVKTALKLAHVRGIALLAVAEAGIALAEYSPLEVKTSVVGYGRAEKFQVQSMVQSLFVCRRSWNRKTRAMRWQWRFATPLVKRIARRLAS